MITSFIQKYSAAFFAAGMVSGFFFSDFFMPVSDHILLIIAVIITLTFLTIDFNAAAHHLRSFHKIGAAVIISKLVLPFILYHAAKPLGPDISIAVLLLALTPFAGITPTFTTLVGGDTEFILVNHVLQTLIAPLYMPALLLLYAGAQIELDVFSMVKTLLFLTIIPFTVSLVIRHFFKKTIEQTKKYYGPANIMLITLLLTGMIATAAEPVKANPMTALPMAGWAIVLGIILVLAGWFCFFFLDRPKRIGLAVSNLYMNIGLSAVLASSFFSPGVLMFILLYELPANLFPGIIGKISFFRPDQKS